MIQKQQTSLHFVCKALINVVCVFLTSLVVQDLWQRLDSQVILKIFNWSLILQHVLMSNYYHWVNARTEEKEIGKEGELSSTPSKLPKSSASTSDGPEVIEALVWQGRWWWSWCPGRMTADALDPAVARVAASFLWVSSWCCFRYLILRFWNQTFTWLGDKKSSLASSSLSAPTMYWDFSNSISSLSSWSWVKIVRILLFLDDEADEGFKSFPFDLFRESNGSRFLFRLEERCFSRRCPGLFSWLLLFPMFSIRDDRGSIREVDDTRHDWEEGDEREECFTGDSGIFVANDLWFGWWTDRWFNPKRFSIRKEELATRWTWFMASWWRSCCWWCRETTDSSCCCQELKG